MLSPFDYQQQLVPGKRHKLLHWLNVSEPDEQKLPLSLYCRIRIQSY